MYRRMQVCWNYNNAKYDYQRKTKSHLRKRIETENWGQLKDKFDFGNKQKRNLRRCLFKC